MSEEKKGSGKKWLIGCCGGLMLLALLCTGGSYFGAGWLKDEAATKVREGMAEMLSKSELSEEQTKGLNAQAERLEAAIKGWSISEALQHLENLEDVGEDVGELGFHAILVSYGSFVLPNTPMPEEERAAGRRILERYARGIDEGKLSLNQSDDSWQLNNKPDSGDEVEFNVDEVRAHLANLESKVNAAGIPDEPYEVDLANKLKEIVDAFIGE